MGRILTLMGLGPSWPTPENLAVSDLYQNKIDLSWDAVADSDGYRIYRRVFNTGSYVEIDDITGTSYTDTFTVADTRYQYVVTAYNGAGESANSNAVDGWSPIYDEMNRTGLLTGTEMDVLSNGQSWVGGIRFILGAGSQDVGSSLETVTTGGGRAITQDASNPPDSRCINAIDFLQSDMSMTMEFFLGSGTSVGKLIAGKIRWDNDRSGYAFHFFHNTLNLFRADAGSLTVLASQSYSSGFQGGKSHKIVFTAQGTDVTLNLNDGETILTASSQTLHGDHTNAAIAIRQDAGSAGDSYISRALVRRPS